MTIYQLSGQKYIMSTDYFLKLMGWNFLLIAVVFALGLATPFARRFYPSSPSFVRRLAAPIIFIVLAVACFAGVGRWALICVTGAWPRTDYR